MSIDQWWETLLLLRKKLKSENVLPKAIILNPSICHVEFDNLSKDDELTQDQYLLHTRLDTIHTTRANLQLTSNLSIEILDEKLEEEVGNFLRIYLPYCFAHFCSKDRGRPLTVAHFAQSLDGRIATNSGHSKWIGGEENLKHAHRMRALCDAVLIGKNTLKHDKPRLTVRRVSGENPVRVVIGNDDLDLKSLVESSGDPILVLGKTEVSPSEGSYEFVKVPCADRKLASGDILNCLFEKNIHSIYVEGGPYTTSRFIAEGHMDILQLHTAPILFGSGIPCAVLPEIKEVGEAVSFHSSFFHRVGKGVMFVGYLNNNLL